MNMQNFLGKARIYVPGHKRVGRNENNIQDYALNVEGVAHAK